MTDPSVTKPPFDPGLYTKQDLGIASHLALSMLGQFMLLRPTEQHYVQVSESEITRIQNSDPTHAQHILDAIEGMFPGVINGLIATHRPIRVEQIRDALALPEGDYRRVCAESIDRALRDLYMQKNISPEMRSTVTTYLNVLCHVPDRLEHENPEWIRKIQREDADAQRGSPT